MQMDESKMEILGAQARPRVRTQARVRYNKSAPYRRAKPTQQKSEKTWRERIVVQAIICGGFLAVLLAFNIVDSAFTNGVTNWVERNLAFDIFADEDGVGSWTDRVLSIFENDDAPTIEHAEGHDPMQTIPEGSLAPGDSWIDESILDDLTN
ncbi:MAG: hypothetical protein LBE35_08795 [Clostridiales bacterium]|jgi:hypothetical protein|nr:hypothetical protein [Clostridiales bacterium]